MLFEKELSKIHRSCQSFTFSLKKSVNNLKCLVFEAKQFFVTSTFLVSTFPRDNGYPFDYHQIYVEIDSLKRDAGTNLPSLQTMAIPIMEFQVRG